MSLIIFYKVALPKDYGFWTVIRQSSNRSVCGAQPVRDRKFCIKVI
ncbi:MAG: hypothetical protein WAT46_10820 [Saprospiraceae bacterium]